MDRSTRLQFRAFSVDGGMESRTANICGGRVGDSASAANLRKNGAQGVSSDSAAKHDTST